ncbi:MAG TPA: tetratricopeptide repeat protein [Pyrinomonadaceae bacterium]|nr:tetratricopeptide repeat protein [Pyrinomonadaceae bacterium]
MRKRTINAFLLALVLTIGVSTFWTATTTEHDGDDAAEIVAADGSPTGTAADDAAASSDEKPKKKGNRFARFLKAPFKAAAKLFGGDDDKVSRLSEKDVAKFESAPLMRVEDSRTASAGSSTDEGGTAKDYLARGRALLDVGRLNEAIRELSRAVSLDARLAEAHNLLAVAYDRKGLHDRARESFERALDHEPDAQTLNNLGYSLYLNGNYRAAVTRLKRAAKLAPADERIWNNLALAQCRLGKYDDAYKSFARSGGEYQGRLNIAAMLERAGREDVAIEHYEAARRVQPQSEFVLRRLIELYTRSGHADRTEQIRRVLYGGANEQVAGKE